MDTRHGRYGKVRAPGSGFGAVTGFAACAAAALGLALTPAGAAHANSTTGTSTVGTAKPITGPAAQSVTLPTGERVTVAVEGGRTVYIPSGGSNFLTYQATNSDQYVIPAEARPYLGRQLDPSLFDVSALIRANLRTPAARVPIRLTFAPGAAVKAPSGVTLTSVGASGAFGYLTTASEPAFAAALRASIGAGVAARRQAGSGRLFGGVTSISLSTPSAAVPSPATPHVSPRYPLNILQINAVDLTGAPAAGAVAFLADTDSVARWHGSVPIDGGIGRVAVPVGHYSAAVQFLDFDVQGNPVALRTVALDDFTVAASGMTTVSFDERAATVPFTVSTPRPATQDSLIVGWVRTDATGASVGFEGTGFGQMAVYSNAVGRPAIGGVRYVVQWDGVGAAPGPAYRYDLAFTSEGIPAQQHHQVRAGQLATVYQNLYTDPAADGPGSMVESVYEPDTNDLLAFTSPTSGSLTDYVGVGAPDRWIQGYATPSGLFYLADAHDFAAGHVYTLQWGHGPAAPNDGSHGLASPISIPCLACVSGGNLAVGFNQVGDSEPDHSGLSTGSTHYALYQNGIALSEATNAFGATVVGIPNASTTYREVLDTDLASDPFVSESTSTHTDLTFRYVPGTNPGDTLPAADLCSYTEIIAAPCQILPILDLDYHLATDLTGTSRSRVQFMRLDVSHLSYSGHGSHAPITAASVSVSFDSGKSWAAATLSGTAGRYLAGWRDPVSAVAVSPELRVTARDAIGGSISQTIVNAYIVAPSVR